jgi:hypothetical protein
MKTETYASILAKRLAQSVKNSGLFRLVFPSRRLVPVPVARRTPEMRCRHSRF